MQRCDDFFAWTVFWRTIKRGNLTKAAIDLDIAPTVASRIVTELEDSVGCKLLERRKRPIVPTSEGQLFYEEIGPLVAEFQRFVVRHSDHSVYSGSQYITSIRCTAALSYGHEFLQPLLAQYMQENARSCFCLYMGKTASELANRKVDVLVSETKISRDDFMCFGTRRLPCVILCSPAYLRKRGTPKTPQDLLQHTGLVMLPTDSSTPSRRLMSGSLHASANFGQLLFSENPFALRENVIRGDGIVFDLPAEFFHEAIEKRELVQILPEWHGRPFDRTICVRAEDWENNHQLRKFTEWLVEKERQRAFTQEMQTFSMLGVSAHAYL